jgi:hypothetical protein
MYASHWKNILMKVVDFSEIHILYVPVFIWRDVFENTGDCRYTRFRFPRVYISVVLFQYHEEHHYPIRGHGRSWRAGPLSCAQFHWLAPLFWLRGLQIKVSHGISLRKSTGMLYVSRFTLFRKKKKRRFAGTQPPRIMRVTCIYNIPFYFHVICRLYFTIRIEI